MVQFSWTKWIDSKDSPVLCIFLASSLSTCHFLEGSFWNYPQSNLCLDFRTQNDLVFQVAWMVSGVFNHSDHFINLKFCPGPALHMHPLPQLSFPLNTFHLLYITNPKCKKKHIQNDRTLRNPSGTAYCILWCIWNTLGTLRGER